MAEAPQRAPDDEVEASEPHESATQAPREDRERPDAQPNSELFIGLVGPIGTDLRSLSRAIERELKRYSYNTLELSLSTYLERLTWDPPREIPKSPYDVRIWEAMDAGNELRRVWDQGDALALLALGDIERRRLAAVEATEADTTHPDWPPTLDRHAYVLRSLKTAEEVATLRQVYGPRFFLIGAYADEATRVANLRDQISTDRAGEPEARWDHAPSQLVDRDWKEQEAKGQNVRGTFHEADFFVDARDRRTVARDLTRVFRILFGDPYVTPTRDEYAMFQAAGAARRSAELGRQVGAAIATKSGSVIALGTNEVPAPGGGSYWEGDSDDHREYTKGKDSNRERQEKIATEIQRLIIERLDDASDALPDEAEPGMQGLREKLVTELPEAILARQVGDLTEFGRATHAEMSALIDAARRGVPVDGATIFSTTFPCHSCARHIIEAGIKRVVFIEPYAKSRALSLHRDTAELVGPGQVADRKVSFEPFVGVAPNRYLRLFDAAWRERRGYPARKTDTGDTIDFVEGIASAVPVFEDLEDEKLRPVVPVYRPRERRAMDQLEDLFAGTKIELKEEQ